MNINNIYQAVAKKYGVSVEEVKRDIEAALQAAWEPPSADKAVKARQKQISPDGKPPSLEKVIQYALDELNAENKK